MPRSRRKPAQGGSPDADALDAFIAEERQLDLEFGAGFDAEVEKLAIGRMLKRARRQQGLSQVELARRAHAHQANIARMEKGAALPKLEVVRRVAMALGMRLTLRLEPARRPSLPPNRPTSSHR